MSTAATKSTELHADLPALKRLVVAALQAQAGCWGDVADPEEQVEIQTDDVGCGGSKTFQLTVKLEGCEPRRVALHSRATRESGGTLTKESEARLGAASRLLTGFGLSPKRLAEGADWYIEVWEGRGQPRWRTTADMRVLGRQVAKLHQLPTDWYDPFRDQLKHELFPGLYSSTPDACHVWWYACRTEFMFDEELMADEEWKRSFFRPLFIPLSKAGGRLVTCHGDLHAGNFVSLAEGAAMEDGKLLFIDLEFAHVSNAASDLGYVCFHYEDMPDKDKDLEGREPPEAMRRAFLESYLEVMEENPTKEDVDTLYIDACLGACGHHFGLCGHQNVFGRDSNELRRFRGLAEELRTQETERASFVELGAEGWFAKKGYKHVFEDKEIDPGVLEAFRWLGRICSSKGEEEE